MVSGPFLPTQDGPDKGAVVSVYGTYSTYGTYTFFLVPSTCANAENADGYLVLSDGYLVLFGRLSSSFWTSF